MRSVYRSIVVKKELSRKIHSDSDDGTGNIYYSLEGIGTNQYPFNVFVVHPRTGLIQVTKILDREDIAKYELLGVATFKNGTEAERKIDIRFKVVDQNDNGPVFRPLSVGVVDELSPTGTSVMKVIATDADEPNHENSQIAYSLINQNPPDDMLYISNDGTIRVKNPSLDRESFLCYCSSATVGVVGVWQEALLRYLLIPNHTSSTYHTEGLGENTEVPLLNTLVQLGGNGFKVIQSDNNNSAMVKSVTSVGGITRASYQSGYVGAEMKEMWKSTNRNISGFYQATTLESRGIFDGGGGIFDDMALPHDFFTHYYSQVRN
ncbi:desmoglein-1-like [Mastacembelus armatus]|uniref:desmoglein-1-like n=1 Tax=Mastacembelus armatus TaxID=205130 RepID=UPI000E46112E|nr:desmoglein-1-like [Mastacembelus armatus]